MVLNFNKFFFLIIFILSCSNPTSTTLTIENEILEAYFNYDVNNDVVHAYCLLVMQTPPPYIYISAELINSDNNIPIITFALNSIDLYGEYDNEYTYIGSSEVDNFSIGNYYIKFTVVNQDGIVELSALTTTQNLVPPSPPEILTVEVTSVIQLDPTEWIELPVNILASDLNGIDNVLRVEYAIKGILISDCTGEVEIIHGCDEDISLEDCDEYDNQGTTANPWILDYQGDVDANFLYHKDILFRPIDGSALLDVNGNEIFPSEECGKYGDIWFQFKIIDKNGLNDIVDNIPLAITI